MLSEVLERKYIGTSGSGSEKEPVMSFDINKVERNNGR